MPISNAVQLRLTNRQNGTGPKPKRGEEIFANTDYPHEWVNFIGQDEAKERLIAGIISANHRNVRLEHTLLASGLHGIGKTTLAYMLAYQAGVGITCVSGPISVDQARNVLRSMRDFDILFWDEFHLAVAGNKNRADWMLPFLTDGVLLTAQGAEQMPQVTVVAATTDAGRLSQTILSRFMVRPRLEGYTQAEAVEIVHNLAERMDIAPYPESIPLIATAASRNPRDMRMILTAIRDTYYTPGGYTFEKALKWAGLSGDGLDEVAQDILQLLLSAKDCTMSIDSIQAQLGEPGPLKHHEQSLLQKGYLEVTARGRKLTDEGMERATRLVDER